MSTTPRAPLLTHLTELRQRLLWVMGLLILSFGICYYYAPELYKILVYPLAQQPQSPQRIIYTHLAEGFLTYVRLSLYGAIMITGPLFLYQLWRFLSPGLYKTERQMIIPLLISSPLLFYAGIIFVYSVIMPLAWSFFLQFQNPEASLPIVAETRMGEYLSLTLSLMLVFGFCAQLPVLLLILMRLNLITVETLKEHRKIAILGAFVIGAILTPPDIFSQIGLALILIVLYEGAIMVGRKLPSPRTKKKP